MNYLFRGLENEFVILIGIGIVLVVVVKEYIKALSRSNLDKFIVPRDELNWSKLVLVVISNILIMIIITLYGFFIEYQGQIISSPPKYSFYLILLLGIVFIISSLFLAFHLVQYKIKRFKNIEIVLVQKGKKRTYLECLIFSFYMSIAFLVITVWYSSIYDFQTGVLNYQELIGHCIMFQAGLYFLFLCVTDIFAPMLGLKFSNRTKFRFRVLSQKDVENLTLYVLHKLDTNILILGNEKDEYKTFYIYDIENDKYLEFTKV